MELTNIERMALVGILARQQQALAPLQEELNTLVRAVEERLELPQGSLGKTHTVDVETGAVSPAAPAN